MGITSWHEMQSLILALLLPMLADGFCPAGVTTPAFRPATNAGLRARHGINLSGMRMQADGVELPGTWVLTAKYEDTDEVVTKFLTLNADCTVTFPPGEEMERDKRVRWKFVPGAPGDAAVNVNQFWLEVPKRSTLSTTFMDRSFQGTYAPDLRTVTGSIIDGEDEPEYVGKFDFKQIASTPSPAPRAKPGSVDLGDWDGEVDEDAWLD